MAKSVSAQHKHQVEYFSKEFVQTDFSRLAPWQTTYIERLWRDGLQRKPVKCLVDVGTGSGYVALDMARRGVQRVIGVDLTPDSIRQLQALKNKRKLKNLELVLASAEDTGLPSGIADCVVANAILEHIAQEKKAIAEWKRLLKKGGILTITVPLKLKYIWPIFWPINYVHDKRIGHLRRYDLEDLSKKFDFKVVSVVYSGHPIKVIGTIVNMFLKSEPFALWLERVDALFSNWKYGGSNISVIFKK